MLNASAVVIMNIEAWRTRESHFSVIASLRRFDALGLQLVLVFINNHLLLTSP